MGSAVLKHSRATSGGAAAKIINRRYPLRKIVGNDEDGREVLECGHTQSAVWDMIGPTYAARRRCKSCPPRDLCTCGHFFDDHAESYERGVLVYPSIDGEIQPGKHIDAGCAHGTFSDLCPCAEYVNDPPPKLAPR